MFHRDSYEPIAKPKRIKDPAARKRCRERGNRYGCENCGSRYRIESAHIIGVGAGGDDVDDNLVALCWDCHHQLNHNGKLPAEKLMALVRKRKLGVRIG